MSTLKYILCNCDIQFETTIEGEIICRNCGCVKGVESYAYVSINSKTNLYLDLELGGKPNREFYSDRYSKSKSKELSAISNICNALHMPQFFSHDVWFWYRKLRSNIKMTRAKIIVLIFYQLCRYNKIPLDEKQLNTVIQMTLGVKYYHNSLKVICKANSFLDENNNNSVLDNIGFNELKK